MLVLMVGPAGAGKTTLAKQLFSEEIIVSSDDLRAIYCGDFKDQSKNTEVFDEMRRVVSVAIRTEASIVVDSTNLKRHDRRSFTGLCPSNYPIIYMVVDRPLKEKLATGGWRLEIDKGEDGNLVEFHHKRFLENLSDILAGDHDPRVTVLDLRKT